MLIVSINKDPRGYKEKVYLGFTTRQLFGVGAALMVNFWFYMTFKNIIPRGILAYFFIAIAIPFSGIGFFEKYNLPFEKYAWLWIKYKFLYPKERNYVSTLSKYAPKIKVMKNKKAEEIRSLELIVLIEEKMAQGIEFNLEDIEKELVVTHFY